MVEYGTQIVATDERRIDVLQVTEEQIDPFYEMTQADMRDQAEPEEAAFLREPENVEKWRATLVEIVRSIDCQLSERKAAFQEFQNSCHKAGPAAKREFFDGQAQYLRWRGTATRAKSSAQNRLSEANTILKVAGRERYASRLEGTEKRRDKRALEYGRALEQIRDNLLAVEEFFTDAGQPMRRMMLTRIEDAFESADKDGAAT